MLLTARKKKNYHRFIFMLNKTKLNVFQFAQIIFSIFIIYFHLKYFIYILVFIYLNEIGKLIYMYAVELRLV